MKLSKFGETSLNFAWVTLSHHQRACRPTEAADASHGGHASLDGPGATCCCYPRIAAAAAAIPTVEIGAEEVVLYNLESGGGETDRDTSSESDDDADSWPPTSWKDIQMLREKCTVLIPKDPPRFEEPVT